MCEVNEPIVIIAPVLLASVMVFTAAMASGERCQNTSQRNRLERTTEDRLAENH